MRPRFLASFREEYPDAGVSLDVGNQAWVWNLLADRRGPVPGGRRTVSVERVGSEVLLLREAGSGTRSTAEELLDELGISPPP